MIRRGVFGVMECVRIPNEMINLMRRKVAMRRLIIAGCILVLVAAGFVAICRLRHQNGVLAQKDVSKEMMDQEIPCVPPKDYTNWMKIYDAKELDPNTQEGRDQLRKEADRIGKAEHDLSHLLRSLPIVLTNGAQNADIEFLSDIERILAWFSRANRARLLKKIGLNGEVDDFRMNLYLQALTSDDAVKIALERYYRIFGQFADMTWRLGGEEFAAAEADRRLFFVLDGCRKSLVERSGLISPYLEKWKAERCDDETSNFCRSHREAEDVYNRYFARAAKLNPKVLKAVSSWYPRHLVWARSILGREPKWSPDFKAK